jgi:hypothetical protein
MFTVLFAKDAAHTLNPSEEKIVDHESRSVTNIFPKDPDVTDLKFFFLPDEFGHKWYHAQTSLIPSKNFTNSYAPQEFGIEKSSTFYDEGHGRTVNISTPVGDEEARNLLVASKNYYNEVTGKVYIKKAAPRLRFRSKDDYDLAA